VRAIWKGAGVALTAGLLMGAAMRPDLAYDDRPAGPQIVAQPHDPDEASPFQAEAVALSAYGSKPPDYVVGTDWRRYAQAAAVAIAPPAPAPAHEEPAPDYYEQALRSYDLTPATYDPTDEAPVPTAVDSEAPPEATGDTTRVR